MTQPTPEAYEAAADAVWITEADARLVVDAVWSLAVDAGYRRAVQALRDEAERANSVGNLTHWAVGAAAADFLDAAAAPRNEGAQT